ncbi:MAG: hypothetical protein EZS26_002515 [Candidatus Ordinivivax streblomastigis]|uniref:TIR domain-containing protein n=1 Tax=Candidatus Ordinivivax streblomastigis TaxID=2540710 RepID=A0A5M8NXL9_9BACT|nr:MAG: hypothetical protein EZS26_002515 [Candidatus Ordinivivax streblomastigis]
MGRTKRKYNHELILFQKTLKKPLANVASVMPVGFSDLMFYSEFKSLYSYIWEDICAKSKEYNRMDEGLVRKGFPKRYYFPSPNNYLKKISAPQINKTRKLHLSPSFVIDEEKRKIIRENLQKDCIQKVATRNNKLQENLTYIQFTTPEYSDYYIDAYFKSKKSNPIDVDTRYAVLMEASKYKSPATIKFLHRVNASERNFNLRNFAFLTLQNFGIKEVRLRKNRKGKKRPGDTVAPLKIETPDDLLDFIYNSQLEQTKMYDLFLSHSSLDSALLLEMKAVLNSDDINVYVDWVSDRNSLKRELTNVNTAKVIIERLNSSKALLYIHTSASLYSKWTPWELGYFHALKNKICVYYPEMIEEIPPYLEIYPTVSLMEGRFFVKDDSGKEVNLKEWIG